MKKRILAMLMCIVLMIGIMPVSALAAEVREAATTVPVETVNATYINPLYKDVIDEKDLVKPSLARIAADVEYYSTIEEAGMSMMEQMKNRQITVTVGLCLENVSEDAQELYDVSDAAMVHTGVPTEGDYIFWQFFGWDAMLEGYYNEEEELYYLTLTYTVTYYTTLEQEAKVDAAVEELLAELDLSEASDYQKVESVYNWICSNITYDYDNLENDEYYLKHTAYAALIDRTCVCQGYAVLMYRLMLELGVDTRVIAGYGYDEAHSWNIVELNGLYYNVDSTWDAGMDTYECFLRSDYNFDGHERWYEYTTEEFYAEYPMADEDYLSGIPIDGVTGECGDDLVWNLSKEGVLTISGEGDMYDFDYYMSPWIEYNNAIESVIIEEGVTSIGGNAFNSCYDIEDVTIANTVVSIGHGAFQECFELSEINIPESVTEIADSAFNYCSTMNAIWVDEDNQSYSSDENGVLYNKNKTELVKVPCAYVGIFDVLAGVTTVGGSAFIGCESITNITIPASVTYIDELTFNNCDVLEGIDVDENNQNYCSDEIGVLFDKNKTKLIKVPANVVGSYIIPDGVTTICYEAVVGCGEITSIYIPASVTNIENLKGCSSLVEIIVDEDNPNYSSENGLLYNNDKSMLIAVPDGITEMLEIPENVTSIAPAAFLYCIGLNTIKFTGKAPSVDSIYGIYWPMVAYYPENDPTWTEDVMQSFGEEVTWFAYDPTNPDAPLPGMFGECGENLTWVLSTDGILTISGEGDMYNYPDEYPDWHGKYINSVIIEEGVTGIGDYAFWCEFDLTSVTIPSSVTYIGDFAFAHCESLTDYAIPESVTYIGGSAFHGVPVNESIGISTGAETIVDLGFCGDNLIWILDDTYTLTIVGEGDMYDYPGENPGWNGWYIESVIINEGVTSIGDFAFWHEHDITSVAIPNSVTYIGEDAFAFCESLTDYTIPENIVYIGVDAFYGVQVSDSLDLSTDADMILGIGLCGKNLLWILDNTNTLTITGEGDMYNYYDDEYPGWYGWNIGEVVVNEGVTSIGDWAFEDCMLDSISLPDSLTRIGEGAFFGSYGLTEIYIPAGVTNIGVNTFRYCYDMSAIWVDEDNEYFSSDEDGILFNKDKTELIKVPTTYEGSYTVPESVEFISSDAFASCGMLTSVIIPAGVIEIEISAFDSCDSLEEIVVDDDNEYFSSDARGVLFDVFDKERTILLKAPSMIEGTYTVPNGVTEIVSGAFTECYNLHSVNIPSSVEYIADYAFHGCYNLMEITVDKDNPNYSNDENGSLYNKNMSELVLVCLPGGVTEMYTVPASVTSIRSSAFENCAELNIFKFVGDAPSFDGETLLWGNPIVYYPENNNTWTEDVMMSICMDGVWIPYDATDLDAPLPGISGVCGENLTWTLSSDGVLTISGEGEMYDYEEEYFLPDNLAYRVEYIVIEEGVTSIGISAFVGLHNTYGISIPASVTKIGEFAFLECYNLTELVVDEDNQVYCTDEYGVLYSKDMSELLYFPGNIYGDYTIPASVTSIPDFAFIDAWVDSLLFTGDAPSFGEAAFYELTANIYYPMNNETWIDDVLQSYEGDIVWVGYDPDNPYLDSGMCGENLTWALTFDGTLIISGEGEMYDYDNYGDNETPWHSEYLGEVRAVVIEEGVTRIGDWAFEDCWNLETISIPDTVTSIGNGAISWCSSLTEVYIPASVTEIDINNFRYCDFMSSIWVDEENEYFSSDDNGVLYNKDKTQLIKVPTAFYGTFNVSASVEDIDRDAFVSCYYLEKIAVDVNNPNYSSDENGVLFNKDKSEVICVPGGMTGELTIPASVTYFDWFAIENIGNLDSIKFEGDAPLLSGWIWDEVTIYYPANNATWTQEILDWYDENVTWIPYDAESSDDYIASGVCGDNLIWTLDKDGVLTVSGDGAMYEYANRYDIPWNNYSSEITGVVIEDGVTTICDAAFGMCYNLTDVILSDSLISIGWRAFYYCSNIISIRIPAGVTEIGHEAFLFCLDLEEITVDVENQRYSSDENGALYDNENGVLVQAPPSGVYGEFIVPDGVESIGYYAFCSCEELTGITLPESLLTIEEGAFSGCYSLISITIPEGVTSIDGYAFLACVDLKEIRFKGDAPEFNEDAFNDVRVTVYYPANNPTWTEKVMHSYGGDITWRPYEADVRLKGDVTGDGDVNNADVVAIARYLVNLVVLEGEAYDAADFDSTGLVNNADLVKLARAIVTA